LLWTILLIAVFAFFDWLLLNDACRWVSLSLAHAYGGVGSSIPGKLGRS